MSKTLLSFIFFLNIIGCSSNDMGKKENKVLTKIEDKTPKIQLKKSLSTFQNKALDTVLVEKLILKMVNINVDTLKYKNTLCFAGSNKMQSDKAELNYQHKLNNELYVNKFKNNEWLPMYSFGISVRNKYILFTNKLDSIQTIEEQKYQYLGFLEALNLYLVKVNDKIGYNLLINKNNGEISILNSPDSIGFSKFYPSNNLSQIITVTTFSDRKKGSYLNIYDSTFTLKISFKHREPITNIFWVDNENFMLSHMGGDNRKYYQSFHIQSEKDSLIAETPELSYYYYYNHPKYGIVKLKGDFFGDNVEDIVTVIKSCGILKLVIINYKPDGSYKVYGESKGDFNEILSSFGNIEKISAGKPLTSKYSNIKNIKLKNDALYLYLDDEYGGGFLFWKNNGFTWLQNEYE